MAAGALVASLFAVGAGPAVALDEDSKPNSVAATSACVGDANDDMMFSDVAEGHIFWGDISCLAYYGVTIGYGDGTFRPGADVSNGEMVLFMQRAAAAGGADAEAVVGDFAETGSDPVHRGDMALLIARLLVEATSEESPVNVKNNDDGTFAVDGVDGDDWDFFADSRRLQNRVSDSAASALYELGVANGTGMGDFSPEASVSRGEMAAFITRALAHTTARPAGVTIQSDGPGEVIVSVRDANFQPVANAAVDVFSADADRVGDVFNADGSCYKAILTGEGGNAKVCEIDALDAVTGLSGDFDPGEITVNVQAGGTTVWAWTGESRDEVEDGGEGLASINLTETAPVTTAGTKITTDEVENADRAVFGSTVTVTIQLVGAAPARADAMPPTGGVTYTVTTRSEAMLNQASDDLTTDLSAVAAGTTVTTQTVAVDASGKGTFTITAADPDPNNADDEEGASVDWVTVTYTVTTAATVPGSTDLLPYVNAETGADDAGVASDTIRFSDAPSVVRRASITPTATHLAAPTTGSTANVVTVKVVDQYGKAVRGHEVVLTGSTDSTFPVARRTDSSGTVRIGYSYAGTGAIEALVANTNVINDDGTVGTPTRINSGTDPDARFYWVSTPPPAGDPATYPVDVTAADLRVADVESNTLVIGDDGSAPQLLVYDDNDQFVIGTDNSTMAAFEAELAKKDTGAANDVGVTQYNPTDASVVARFTLTVNS